MERSIHLAGIVGEHPVTQQSLGHLQGLAFAVAGFGSNQGQQSGPDGANGFFPHFNLGLGDTLDEGKHGRI